MTKEPNKQQQKAIDACGQSNIIVSASAGTGKTTTMLASITKLIAGTEDTPAVDVDNLIVVTFTNYAAKEMKTRLATELAQLRKDVRIEEQLDKLDNASICTLHSFCGELLRNYFYVADVDPSFQIIDSLTAQSLQKTALKEVFDEYFAKDDKVFQQCYHAFSRNRDEESFYDKVLRLYEFSRNKPDFKTWYDDSKQNFTLNSKFITDTILEDIRSNVAELARNLREMARKFDAMTDNSLSEICEKNAEMYENLVTDNLEDTVNDIAKAKWNNFANFDKNKDLGIDKETERQLRDEVSSKLRNNFKKYVDGLTEITGGRPLEQAWKDVDDSVIITDKLVEIVIAFDTKYSSLKKQRGQVDFNDLEHLALKILDNDKVSADIDERYKYVFIDEYQDTNPMQEAIIDKISHNKPLFMVGDVKQSIYAFRSSQPKLFNERYDRYRADTNDKAMELSLNYRSDCNILDFVNNVFDVNMTKDFGQVDYTTCHLEGNTHLDVGLPNVRVDVITKQKPTPPTAQDVYDITRDYDSVDTSVQLQAKLAVNRIKEYVGTKCPDGSVIDYKDVVILARSMENCGEEICNVLVNNNVPVVSNMKTDSLKAKQIRDVVNLMRVVDNPYNDLYVVGSCLSFFGKFSEDQLATVKLATGEGYFFNKLAEYGNNNTDEVATLCNNFVQLINKLRFDSESATLDALILKVLQLTDYHLYVESLPNGSTRVRKLYDYIDALRNMPYSQSISKYLNYIDDADKHKEEEGIPPCNAVRLMTVHSFKGLDAKVVILINSSKDFNERALHDDLLVNSEVGIVCKLFDFDNTTKRETLGTYAMSAFNKKREKEEELRILYVALTRPECCLDVIGAVDDSFAPKQGAQAKNHLQWIMSALQQTKCNAKVEYFDNVQVNDNKQADVCEQITDPSEIEDNLYNNPYPFKQATELPNKVVSSKLDAQFIYNEQSVSNSLDGDDDAEPGTAYHQSVSNSLGRDGDAELGTAYHTVYRYINYDADVDEIRDTVQRLVADDKITADVAKQLDLQLIHKTINNATLRKIMQQGTCYRELPFMLYVPYCDVADSKVTDEVTLQGVIDLLVVNEERAFVIDFKYTKQNEQNIIKHYKRQLNSYKLAVERILGKKDVSCYVLSVIKNKLIKM